MTQTSTHRHKKTSIPLLGELIKNSIVLCKQQRKYKYNELHCMRDLKYCRISIAVATKNIKKTEVL